MQQQSLCSFMWRTTINPHYPIPQKLILPGHKYKLIPKIRYPLTIHWYLKQY